MFYSKEYEKNLQSLIKKELWNPNLTNPNLNIKKILTTLKHMQMYTKHNLRNDKKSPPPQKKIVEIT